MYNIHFSFLFFPSNARYPEIPWVMTTLLQCIRLALTVLTIWLRLGIFTRRPSCITFTKDIPGTLFMWVMCYTYIVLCWTELALLYKWCWLSLLQWLFMMLKLNHTDPVKNELVSLSHSLFLSLSSFNPYSLFSFLSTSSFTLPFSLLSPPSLFLLFPLPTRLTLVLFYQLLIPTSSLMVYMASI